jgi:hypothetical protein
MFAVVFPMLFFFAVFAFVAWFAIRKAATRGTPAGDWPLYAKDVLSQPERVLYDRLAAALPDHIVLTHVPLSRALGVKHGYNVNEWSNRINRLSYDFVVCQPDSRVLAAVELDDGTRGSRARTGADRKREMASASAGIRLIRWQVTALPDTAAIRREIMGLTNSSDGQKKSAT